ncbi:hypothetical protein [Dapis sp. BLCC M126]
MINKFYKKQLPIPYWCQDKLELDKKLSQVKITACAVKPIGLYQWLFEYL